MVTNALTFRSGTPGDDGQVVALFNKTFRTPTLRREWEWFVYENPWGPNRIYVAENSQGRVVGTYCFFPARMWSDNRLIDSSFAHHLVVDTAHRNARTFVEFSHYVLEQEKARGAEVAITTPNASSYLPHKALARWCDFGHLDQMHRLSPQARPHRCCRIDRFDEGFAPLWESARQRFAFTFPKTCDWMNWRFARCYGRAYTTYAFHDDDGWHGYVVLKHWQDASGYRKTHIMDLLANDESALAELLNAAESYAGGCDEINLWCLAGYPYRAELERRGFAVRESAGQPVIVRALNSPIPSSPSGAGSFMYGDSDGY